MNIGLSRDSWHHWLANLWIERPVARDICTYTWQVFWGAFRLLVAVLLVTGMSAVAGDFSQCEREWQEIYSKGGNRDNLPSYQKRQWENLARDYAPHFDALLKQGSALEQQALQEIAAAVGGSADLPLALVTRVKSMTDLVRRAGSVVRELSLR